MLPASAWVRPLLTAHARPDTQPMSMGRARPQTRGRTPTTPRAGAGPAARAFRMVGQLPPVHLPATTELGLGGLTVTAAVMANQQHQLQSETRPGQRASRIQLIRSTSPPSRNSRARATAACCFHPVLDGSGLPSPRPSTPRPPSAAHGGAGGDRSPSAFSRDAHRAQAPQRRSARP